MDMYVFVPYTLQPALDTNSAYDANHQMLAQQQMIQQEQVEMAVYMVGVSLNAPCWGEKVLALCSDPA
jgi:hypothetical protein